MKLLNKFDPKNWKQVYGSVWVEGRIGPINGDITFGEQAIVFSNGKNDFHIDYFDLKLIAEKVNPLLFGSYLMLQTNNGATFHFLVPNVKYYLEKLSFLSANSIVKRKIYTSRTITALFYFLSFYSLFAIPASASLIASKYPHSGLVIIINICLNFIMLSYIAFVLFSLKKKKKELPYIKLLILAWVVPFYGSLIGTTYLIRYLVRE